MIKFITDFFKNIWSPTYKTIWTEDLPQKLKKNVIYIVGGEEYPFQAVFLCPRKCSKMIFLNVSEQHKEHEKWTITKHRNNTISLQPSIWMKNNSCGCHYWFKKGKIIWCFD